MQKQNETNSDYSGLDELLNVEVMKNYNSFIVELAMKHSKNAKRVVDFGAGIGTLSLILKESYSIQPLCVEIDEVNKGYLSKRKFSVIDNLSTVDGDIDLIFSSNVLEHIENDILVLKEMEKRLSVDGKLFLHLPAKMLLWSKFDEEVGHYRRYELTELKLKCESVGLKIDSLHYADSGGFFASLAMKIIGYDKDGGIGSLSSLKFYDRWLFPISKFFDGLGFKYLFGKNVVLIASKK